MQVRDKLNKRIEEKRAEIEELEAKARDARIYIQALEDTVRLLPKDPLEEDAGDFSLRPGSNVDRAREAIKGKGSPMHVTELLNALGKTDDAGSRAALASSISSYVRRGQIFTRPAPNTFGLVEFTPVRMPQRNGPPPAFGMDESTEGVPEDEAAF